jgi:hypothetical protein
VFALQLLHERGVTGQDRWFSRLRPHRLALRPAVLRDRRAAALGRMLVSGGPLIVAQPIPPLKQRQVEVRFAF